MTQDRSACEKQGQPEGQGGLCQGKEKKRSKKKEKKALGKNKTEKEASGQGRREGATSQTSELEKQTALDLLNNPEAKGRGLVGGNREKKELAPGSQATSRGECSGWKTPDST